MLDLTKLSQADLIKLVQTMQAQPARKLSLKVSEKGAVSLYGMGRWPVTLYKSQWMQLLGATKQIETFLADNAALLKDKGE